MVPLRAWFGARQRWVLLLLVGVLIGLSGCAGQGAGGQGEIRIGVLASQTGDFAELGRRTVNSAKLVEQEVNATGGVEVNGRKYKLVLVVADDTSQPDAGVNAARQLINQENVVALVGPVPSNIAIPVSIEAENAKVPMLSPGSTNPQTTSGKQFVFRTTFVDTVQGQVSARFAFESLGVQKAAVLYDVANEYSRGLAEIFREAFAKTGGEVVAFETFTSDDNRDFTAQLTRIRESGAQVLFLPNYYTEVPIQVTQARELGMDIPILGADAWSNIKAGEWDAVEGAFYTSPWSPDNTDPRSQKFVEAYRQAYNESPTSTNALTYDSFGLLFNAMQSQGDVTAEAIRAGLAGTDTYDGVSGTIGYHGSGDPTRSVTVMHVKEGQPTFYQVVDP